MSVIRSSDGPRIHIHKGLRENSCRPAVDVLFRSLAETYREGVISVVLTGMGQDGLRGVRVLREQGAHVIVQDEASSVVWGMPGFVARAGLADENVPLQCVVPEILKEVSAHSGKVKCH